MTYSNDQRLPEKYYRRRRAAAVVVLLVVIGLLVWGLTALARSGGDDEPASGAAGVEETTAASSSESAEPSETESESESESESEEPSETARAAGEDGCTLEDLQITADSNRATYPAGEQPTFYMTVANPTDEDCHIDLDENTLRFEVYDLATNERIWSDVDCYDSVQTGEETFPAGEERFFEAVWSRTASAPGQCDNRPDVPAGSYFLHTVIGENPSPAHTFNLR